MYIDVVPNRSSPPATLLREGWRVGSKVHKRTIANLSKWPTDKVEMLRRVLKDEPLMGPEDVFTITRSLPHGHVQAVLGTVRKLGLERLIAAKPCRERDLIVALVVERVLFPCSKLATTRLWQTTTLGEELNVNEATVDDLYDAMDWLLTRQARIEKQLATGHLTDGDHALYDISSSYYEGHTCPLARLGHNRDGKKGKPIIVYGLLTNAEGCPVAVQVYEGNTGDPETVSDQVEKLRDAFGLERVVLVGDRGMLTDTKIETLKAYSGLGWISALRSHHIRQLIDTKHLQLSLFDQKHLAEIVSPRYPHERLVACFNPFLAEERKRKRAELIAATEAQLQRVARDVGRRTKTPFSAAEIGQKVGRVIHRYKVAKYFKVTIQAGFFRFETRPERIQQDRDLDGIYVVRTSESEKRLPTEDVVRSYKNLSKVEQAFRSLKQIDLWVRPIYHRLEDRVRAHIFVCMLAYYVVWHMRKALAPLLFEDEALDQNRQKRDPVLPTQPSRSAQEKKRTQQTANGFPVHSFTTLMQDLSTCARSDCRLRLDKSAPIVKRVTELTPLHREAFSLLGLFPSNGH